MATMTPEDLKDFQLKLKLNNQEFADFLGVSRRTIEDWRSGARNILGLTVFALRTLIFLDESGRDIGKIMADFRDSGVVGGL